MTSFFRKIRIKLLKTNNLKRYLLYATGEILLVMIGILLALQVNNWNQNRLIKKQEKVLLEEIQSEFIYNESEFKENLRRYSLVRTSLTYIGNLFPIEVQELELDSFAFHLQRTRFSGNFDFSKTSIEKIRNASSFDIISDDELRNLLIKWEVALADYIEIENQALKHLEERYEPLISEQLVRPFEIGLKDSRTNLEYFSTISFESLIITRKGKINNMYRHRKKEDQHNMVKMVERIIELSARG